MKKDYFKQLLASGLRPDWSSILVGWEGLPSYGRLISSEEVVSYATDQIGFADADQAAKVEELAFTDASDMLAISENLRCLAGENPIVIARAKRLWCVVLLRILLANLSDDPIYGLIELTSFWSNFDYPSDSPHIIQGVHNNMDPSSYYTEANLRETVRTHRKWLDREEYILSH